MLKKGVDQSRAVASQSAKLLPLMGAASAGRAKQPTKVTGTAWGEAEGMGRGQGEGCVRFKGSRQGPGLTRSGRQGHGKFQVLVRR